MKNKLFIIVLLLTICCSNEKYKNEYSMSVHYQYVVFKLNDKKRYDVYIENFINIKNMSNDTLLIPFRDIKNNLRMINLNNDSMSLNFMSNDDFKIAPLDSIDLNCAVNLKQTLKDIPAKLNGSDYKIYDKSTKKYLTNTEDYEVIQTTKFGIFKEKYLK
jgi:gamma-glutamylcysteine synthetase